MPIEYLDQTGTLTSMSQQERLLVKICACIYRI